MEHDKAVLQFKEGACSCGHRHNEGDTADEQLRLFLHEHRYLVVLDDIWKKEFWEFIELALPNNEKSSRILITSQDEDVAPYNDVAQYKYLNRLPILPSEKA